MSSRKWYTTQISTWNNSLTCVGYARNDAQKTCFSKLVQADHFNPCSWSTACFTTKSNRSVTLAELLTRNGNNFKDQKNHRHNLGPKENVISSRREEGKCHKRTYCTADEASGRDRRMAYGKGEGDERKMPKDGVTRQRKMPCCGT